MLRHKTQLFLHPLFFFNRQIALPSMGLLALTTCGRCRRIYVHHIGTNRITVLCRSLAGSWMDSYAVLAAALFFIPSFWGLGQFVLDMHEIEK